MKTSIRPNESNVHYFLIKQIESYLKQYTNKVELFNSVNADIVFKVGKKKIAIEVETGNKIKHDKNKVKQKVEDLNKTYGKNWYFVITDGHDRYLYEQLGQTYTRKEITSKIRSYFNKSF